MNVFESYTKKFKEEPKELTYEVSIGNYQESKVHIGLYEKGFSFRVMTQVTASSIDDEGISEERKYISQDDGFFSWDSCVGIHKEMSFDEDMDLKECTVTITLTGGTFSQAFNTIEDADEFFFEISEKIYK